MPDTAQAERWAKARASVSRWLDRASNPSLPLWLRVVFYAEAKAGPNGHAPMTQGQLRGMDRTYTASAYSRAISQAIAFGLLDSSSTARCLVLPGHSNEPPCPATHRPAP